MEKKIKNLNLQVEKFKKDRKLFDKFQFGLTCVALIVLLIIFVRGIPGHISDALLIIDYIIVLTVILAEICVRRFKAKILKELNQNIDSFRKTMNRNKDNENVIELIEQLVMLKNQLRKY